MTMLRIKYVVFLLWTLLVTKVTLQSIDDEQSESCTSAVTCGKCIRMSPLCAWCGAENFNRDAPRCDIVQNLRRKNCPDADITNPKSSFTVIKNNPQSDGGQGLPHVQVKPQDVEFKVRPSEAVSFTLNFRQGRNYPVDLYFLLDLTYGMVRQKEAQQRLIALGLDIPKSISDITNNFRLGFGTFVDKLLLPYVAWTDELLQNLCPLQGKKCRRPHDFKNHLSLADNAENFAISMKEALEDISQSIDDAEGGLDGLIQVLDCDVIGWRDVSRRIIVYSSNSYFHTAGSGKLGGATRQSNLKCALNSEGLYEDNKIYDYPSVSQVASKLIEKKANIIFAVMGNVKKDYDQLGGFFDNAVVDELLENSTNIVELIKEAYHKLRSEIIFKPKNADDISVTFRSKCLGETVKETARCDNLSMSQSVEFNVTLIASSDICKDSSGIVEKRVTLDAVGLNEQVYVTMKVKCGCDCESPEQEEANSHKCFHGNGTFECGICNCHPERYGRNCECDATEISNEKSLQQCKMNVNDTLPCSGQGECICGVCSCFTFGAHTAQKYSGVFCQCNDFSCPTGSDGLCGGSLRGACTCGKCHCFPGWTGDNCECTTDTGSCMTAAGKMCNDYGRCKCGRCICTEGMLGPTCEDCPTCAPQCSEYIDCVQCKAHGTGKHNKEECELECYNVEQVDTLQSGKGIRECNGIDVDGCTFYFTYEYTQQNDLLIKAQKTKVCPEEAPVAAIVGGTVAAVVLIPLLIICLIIFIRNRRDAKEYADFMKERNRAKWESGANPIYKDPKSTFQNPTYKGGKK